MISRFALKASALTTLIFTAVTMSWLPALADPQQAPGTRIKIEAASLPKPGDTPSSSNSPKSIPKPADATLSVQAGFAVNVFAEKLGSARNMILAPNGDIFLAEQNAGRVTLLRDADGDGKAETVVTFADGFKIPYGIAFGKGAVYIGDIQGVWRIPYSAGDTTARAKQTMITPAGAFGANGGHVTRNVNLNPDGTKLFVSIGSSGNIGEDPSPRATIQEFDLDAAGTTPAINAPLRAACAIPSARRSIPVPAISTPSLTSATRWGTSWFLTI